jgi:hypothetical protein
MLKSNFLSRPSAAGLFPKASVKYFENRKKMTEEKRILISHNTKIIFGARTALLTP